MTDLIEQLVASPRLALYQQEIEKILKDERARRQYFYDVITESEKAEFINGEVVIHSPVKLMHNGASINLAVLLKTHVLKYRLGYVGHEKLLVSLSRNDYEPDVCFWGEEKAAWFTPDQMHFPAPDFVAEVLSPSTEKVDRGVKFEDYAAHGVLEYWIVVPEDQVVEQYKLEGDTYRLQVKASSGEIRSIAVEGFEIPVRALFDDALHIETLQRILAG
jgi:Uma2 family endonuclease